MIQVLLLAIQNTFAINQPVATLLAALITGTIALSVGILAYFLGRMQKEHEVRFSGVYERRAVVLADLNKLLYKISRRFEDWEGFHRVQMRQEERDEAFDDIKKKLEEFSDVYRQRDVWIPKATSKELDVLYDRVSKVWNEAARGDPDKIEKVIRTYPPEIARIRKELKEEFARALGIPAFEVSMDHTDMKPVVDTGWRVIFGLAGPALMGIGVAGALTLLNVFDDYWVLLCGFSVGLGIGLLLEYLRPTMRRAPIRAEQAARDPRAAEERQQAAEERQ